MAPSLVLAGCAFAPAMAGVRDDAMAYDRSSGRLLYRETHWLYREDGLDRRLVLYRCVDGPAFARKTVLQRPTALAPDFDFIDARDGYQEGVRTRAGNREVYVRKQFGAELETRPLAARKGAVIDVGFDAFVHAHWDALSRPAVVMAPFLLPSRFGYLDFKVSNTGDTTLSGRPVRRLRMALAAWYAFAVPALELTYGRDDRRLLEFRGMGTIRDGKGRHQDVRIVFPATAGAGDVPRAEIDRAARMPLADRCPA